MENGNKCIYYFSCPGAHPKCLYKAASKENCADYLTKIREREVITKANATASIACIDAILEDVNMEPSKRKFKYGNN